MFFHYAITVPANTLVTNPVIEDFSVGIGTIQFIEVEFPNGCVGLVHTTIEYNTIQIVPYNPTGNLYGNGRVFHIPMNYPLMVQPYDLRFILWNNDDTYPHTLSYGIMMQDPSQVTTAQLLLQG